MGKTIKEKYMQMDTGILKRQLAQTEEKAKQAEKKYAELLADAEQMHSAVHDHIRLTEWLIVKLKEAANFTVTSQNDNAEMERNHIIPLSFHIFDVDYHRIKDLHCSYGRRLHRRLTENTKYPEAEE